MSQVLQAYVAMSVGALLAVLSMVASRYAPTPETKPDKPFVDDMAKCPACGWRGADLGFVEPRQIVGTDDKRTISTTEPLVLRKCRKCSACCYENTVKPAKEWIKS